jgi:ubiquinone/menaquinone biosynthesis C-methylase UbiE
MQNNNSIQTLLGQTDIYLIDQIMKGRYNTADTILDAGCGNGRNMYWFLQNGFNISGIDINEVAIAQLKNSYPDLTESLAVSSLENIPFSDNHFDHIICSAVLHFAKTVAQFNCMLTEMVRVLKPGGSLFIRMTTDIGMEDKVQLIADGVYTLPDGSVRFLLTRHLLAACKQQNNLSFIEPLKTVNVDDVRCMSTLLLQKNSG